MPKQFASPPDKEQPKDSNSFDPHAADLASLVWSGAPHEQIAEVLRVRDEPSANLVATLLQAVATAAPIFRAAIRDGEGAALRRRELESDLDRLRRMTTPAPEQMTARQKALDACKAELREAGTRDSAATAARYGLATCLELAPSLLSHEQGQAAGKSSDLASVQEHRVRLMNWANENKIELQTKDGWPKSTSRRDSEPRRSVRLVTVQPSGMRGSK